MDRELTALEVNARGATRLVILTRRYAIKLPRPRPHADPQRAVAWLPWEAS